MTGSTVILLALIVTVPVSCIHINPGCLSYKYKKNLLSASVKMKADASGSEAEWCTDPEMTSNGMKKKRKGEKNQAPFLIHTFNYTKSNAVRVKIRGKRGELWSKNSTFIEECIVQARSAEDMKVIGKFYPFPPDVQLTCCQNILDLNTARIFRPESVNQNSSVNFLWIPSEFLEDFTGPFKFVQSFNIESGRGLLVTGVTATNCEEKC